MLGTIYSTTIIFFIFTHLPDSHPPILFSADNKDLTYVPNPSNHLHSPIYFQSSKRVFLPQQALKLPQIQQLPPLLRPQFPTSPIPYQVHFFRHSQTTNTPKHTTMPSNISNKTYSTLRNTSLAYFIFKFYNKSFHTIYMSPFS